MRCFKESLSQQAGKVQNKLHASCKICAVICSPFIRRTNGRKIYANSCRPWFISTDWPWWCRKLCQRSNIWRNQEQKCVCVGWVLFHTHTHTSSWEVEAETAAEPTEACTLEDALWSYSAAAQLEERQQLSRLWFHLSVPSLASYLNMCSSCLLMAHTAVQREKTEVSCNNNLIDWYVFFLKKLLGVVKWSSATSTNHPLSRDNHIRN